MSDKEKLFIKQIEDILKNYETFKNNIKAKINTEKETMVVNSLITRIKATIKRITGNNSEYYKRIEDIFIRYEKQFDYLKLEPLIGVLDALYQDLKAGFLMNFSELIHADIFSDYIEMAEYLLEEGYKDPAAVITGSTLEEHLRNLCQKNGIDVEVLTGGKSRPKKADTLNSELAKQNVYNKLGQKSVTTWLDLRNKAAHAHYNEYDDKQVDLMIKGVRDFIIRNPA